MIAELIYLLCAATGLIAAALLIRQYRAVRTPLLFWSALSFAGLGLNNVLVYLDLGLLPGTDLAMARALSATSAMLALVYGLVRGAR